MVATSIRGLDKKRLTAATVKALDINYLNEIYISIIARNEVKANGSDIT